MPNIQTIPRADKAVKRAFVPKLDAFLLADYPNIELKLLAFYLETIGHPSMADIFRDGADLHTRTAAGVLGLPIEACLARDAGGSDETDKNRQVGKVLNFSIVYGGGMPTIMEQLGVEKDEALNILKNYHATWPGIGWETKRKPAPEGTLIWAIKQQLAARERQYGTGKGYITTLYGRHLHPRKLHAALNNVCQGSAADLKKWAMVQTHRNLKQGGFTSHIVNDVHDELMFDCVAGELPQLNELIPEWMTDPRIEAVVPIKPSCDLTFKTWADKAPYEEALLTAC